MKLELATKEEIWVIQLLSKHTWPHTFADILTAKQIDYMMEMMYSTESLQKQMDEGHHYVLAKENDEYLGYLSYQLDYKQEAKTKIHKIYVLPTTQGKGVGRFLIDSVFKLAEEKDQERLLLNVNRFNKAIEFYKRMDFRIIGEEDIDIGDGFLMEDYIMQKDI